MSELAYWLLLLKAPLVGSITAYKALKYFESPKNIFTSTDIYRKNSGLFKQKTLNWFNSANINLVSKDLKWAEKSNHHIITLIDDDYPPLLKEIADPPLILYVMGDISVLSVPQIAIVGSRAPSINGLENAYYFAKQLALNNLVITSGLALGIDARAHISAIDNNGKTIAVCGTGLDIVYPTRHKNLVNQIIDNGAVISEFPIGVAPHSNNFPKRNRVISGLSLGVLVVEATLQSGSLISARLAVEQGREVFAIPSVISNYKAKGCHKLIKDGACLTDSIDDILANIGMKNTQHITDKVVDNKKNIDKQSSILLKYLSYSPVTVDDLVLKTNLDIQTINEKLLLLELSGEVYNIPNSGFVLNDNINL